MITEDRRHDVAALRQELTELRLDVWGQFSLEMDDGWHSAGALSTLESIAKDLTDSGVFEKHHRHQWYRMRAPGLTRTSEGTDRAT
jgi:hypothetical protein